MLIELTNERFEKFWLSIDKIVSVVSVTGGKSQINLINGKYVVCVESKEDVAEKVNSLARQES